MSIRRGPPDWTTWLPTSIEEYNKVYRQAPWASDLSLEMAKKLPPVLKDGYRLWYTIKGLGKRAMKQLAENGDQTIVRQLNQLTSAANFKQMMDRWHEKMSAWYAREKQREKNNATKTIPKHRRLEGKAKRVAELRAQRFPVTPKKPPGERFE